MAKLSDPDEALAAALEHLTISDPNTSGARLEAFRRVAAARNWGVGSRVWCDAWEWFFGWSYSPAQNPFVEEPHNAYFDQFTGFDTNPRSTLRHQFAHLASTLGWKEGSKEWKCGRAKLFGEEFASIFGSEGTLAEWQRFCASVGIEGIPDTVKKCKKALRRNVHVNIINLLEHQRNPAVPLITYGSYRVFRSSISQPSMCFPRTAAKENEFLTQLLRKLY